VIELFTPIISSVIGIGGAFLQRKHERHMFELVTERARVENAHEMALTEMHMQARREEVEQEIALTEVAGNIAAFAGSQQAENALSSLEWGRSRLGDVANFARAITRPGITWYLVIATSIRTWSYYGMTRELAGGENDLSVMQTAFEQMMGNPFDLSLVSLTSMVVGWWFGSRGSKTSYQDDRYRRKA